MPPLYPRKGHFCFIDMPSSQLCTTLLTMVMPLAHEDNTEGHISIACKCIGHKRRARAHNPLPPPPSRLSRLFSGTAVFISPTRGPLRGEVAMCDSK